MEVIAVSSSPVHGFSKSIRDSILLLKGLGVEGDAHCGEHVRHRSRVAHNPDQPNLRQVHLLHAEALDGLQASGFKIAPGELGENITTRGIDLLSLPRGAKLHIGASAIVEVTGLRNPCLQLDQHASGLMHALMDQAEDGRLIRKAGVMGIVLEGGKVQPGDVLHVELPPHPWQVLDRV